MLLFRRSYLDPFGESAPSACFTGGATLAFLHLPMLSMLPDPNLCETPVDQAGLSFVQQVNTDSYAFADLIEKYPT